MSKRIFKHNPAFFSSQELVSTFAARKGELALLVQRLKENTTNTNQHVLVIGQRGSGKTMLVLRLMHELSPVGDPELEALWYPLRFAEESYAVATPGEFWLEALGWVAVHTGEPKWDDVVAELRRERDEQRLADGALARLLQFSSERKKRLLLIVENLNMLFGQQLSRDAAWIIRKTLMHEPRIMLLGTAIARFEAIENAGDAFFDLFTTIELRPLALDECRDFWRVLANEDLAGRRARAVQILTGGNPRMLAILASFAANRNLVGCLDDFERLMDDNTEYFKSNVESLPPQERKVFVSLAGLWGRSTARQTAALARLDVNKTSAILDRLVDKGVVSVVPCGRGKNAYEVSERIYCLFQLLRQRGEGHARVLALVRFMRSYYASRDLCKLAASLAREASDLPFGFTQDHWLLMLKLGNLEDAERAIQGALNRAPDDAFAQALFGTLCQRLGRSVEAEQAYRAALVCAPDDAGILFELGRVLYENPNRLDEAEEAYRRAIELHPEVPSGWVLLGKLLHEKFGRDHEAEEALRKAIGLGGPWSEYACTMLCGLLLGTGNGAAAMTEAEKCLESTARSARSLNGLAWTWFKQGRPDGLEQAESWAEEAVRDAPDDADFLHTLAAIRGARGRWTASLGLVPRFLSNKEMVERVTEDVVKFFVSAAAAGLAPNCAEIIEASPSAAALKPLVVALRMIAGHEVSAPPEVIEVANDIVDDYRALVER